MDISIRRIFQLCAVLIVVAAIYRAGNTGFEAPSTGESALWDILHTLIAPLARVYLSMFGSPATAILLSGALVLAGILLVLWFVFLKVRPMLSLLDRLASDCARAPVQGGHGEGLDRVLGPSFLGPDWRAWRAAGDSGARPSAYITLGSLERSGLREHWASGHEDTKRSLKRRDWIKMPENGMGIVIHDVHRESE